MPPVWMAQRDKNRKPGFPGKVLFRLFRTVADHFNGKAESQGKGNTLPKRLVFHKCNDHHYKAKDAYHYRQGIFFSEIVFHMCANLKSGSYTKRKVSKCRVLTDSAKNEVVKNRKTFGQFRKEAN
jgi:hypothetical protein